LLTVSSPTRAASGSSAISPTSGSISDVSTRPRPTRQLYPEYRFLLHEGMVAETRAFLRELIATDAPIRALVRPDFAMLTQRLAEHYGIAEVHGVEVRRVALPAGSPRGGLLGQAAILKLTANGTPRPRP